MSGLSARARNSIGSDSVNANRSALARASVLGTSSAKTIVNRASTTVTSSSETPWAVPESIPEPASTVAELVGQAHRRERRGEEADERETELGDREEAAGLVEQPLHAPGARAALLDELLDPAAADGDQGDLGGDEEPLEQRQEDDDEELARPGRFTPAASGPRRSACAASASAGSGSRIRAGTPTASLPGGTSFVTTAPAPVLAPAPISRGRDDHRVDADERPVADRRPVLAACRRSWR